MKYGLILVRAHPGLLKMIVLFSVQQFKRATAFFYTPFILRNEIMFLSVGVKENK